MLRTLAVAAIAVAAAGTAAASRAPAWSHPGPALEVAAGPPVRVVRAPAYHRPPAAARRAWRAFVADVGPTWTAMWDVATGTPIRAWGRGLPAPGATASATAAERYARAFVERHIDLLAPGSAPGDLHVVSNVVHAGIRSVGFRQTVRGIPVLGGQVSVRFRADRLFMIASEAFPHVSAPPARPVRDRTRAAAKARAWLEADGFAAPRLAAFDGPYVLPLVDPTGVRAYRTVYRAEFATRRPATRWDVFVDAWRFTPVARRQTLMFASGHIAFDAPVRRPTGDRADYVAPHVDVTVDGEAATTDADGVLSWPGDAPASVTVTARGALVAVDDAAGDPATADVTLAPGGTARWSAPDDERVDAQLATYIHANRVKAYCKGITPDMAWLDEPIRATVNIDDNCNAFSDGTNINFFTRGGGCENTGRLADVVYHEFGHSYHAHSIIDGVGQFDGALSEGVSDYLAATITGDPGMGRGFFFTNQPLRDIDPTDDPVFPDDLQGEVHADGILIAATLWDLRELLIAKYGQADGVARADRLFQAGIARASDMPTMYPEVLAANDDDGDLTNGTPDECEINEAFGRHGLRAIDVEVSPLGVEIPQVDGFHVALAVRGLSPRCDGEGIAAATLEWNLRSDPARAGQVDMAATGDGAFEGAIPPQPEGEVVQYRIVVRTDDGSEWSLPQNRADPRYELFVGAVTELYCTDFESDPAVDGWTHGLRSGADGEGADDWQWDVPAGRAASGDPDRAFSGERAFGNDLGHDNFNGSYQPDKVNFARMPVVDASGYSVVRLQYRRWLNVEDGSYDRATIYANGEPVWQNLATEDGTTHHQDREWRFHDVDLTRTLAPDGTVQVEFELASDGGLEFGGWTVDDVCIVAYAPSVCGDGVATGIEQCDDGPDNADAPDACRTNCTLPMCGDGIVDAGEECDDGNADPGDDCLDDCTRPDAAPGSADCGCRAGGTPHRPWTAPALVAALAVVALRRRARRRRPRGGAPVPGGPSAPSPLL